jgi:hypothetical protein
MGFPVEAPVVYEFPVEMFLPDSDLTPLNENFGKIVDGLTKWQPKVATKGLVKPDLVTIQGKDYQDAVDNMNLQFMMNNWSDGLPVVPPTDDRVKWILTGTDLPRDTVIAKPVYPSGGIATVESIAVALAMAGGRPEYLPVLIAAVDATNDPAFGFNAVNAGTGSVVPAIIVNGPIAQQIRLSSGYGLLGPDPQHPAGETIGRALRIIQQNVGGAIPGIGTMAMFGGFRATDIVFAEDEGGLPKGWNSLAVDRGFAKDANVVTATPVNSMVNVSWFIGTKETNDHALATLAGQMASPNLNAWSGVTETLAASPNRAAGVALIPRAAAGVFASSSGYSKADIKTFLWNKSKLPWSEVVASGLDASLASLGVTIPDGQDLPLTAKPEQITVVVAGGDRSGNGYWMAPGDSNHTMVSKEIKLPANWDALIKQNETDLGAAPSNH